jgi:L-fuconolactonase
LAFREAEKQWLSGLNGLCKMSERVDAHHHLWRYNKEEYGWIGKEMSILAKDFLPSELERQLARSEIHGSITVQARQTLEETRWLLELAEKCCAIRGVVGWAPIAAAEFPGVLERLHQQKKLKGLRHVIQDEPDDEFILRADFNIGVALLKQYSLVYDILIFARHLPAAISFVDRHPAQIFVLDHAAKPNIRAHELEPWRTDLRTLARRENVYCKLSGLVTEANWLAWQPADLQPYVETVLEAFGPKRVMAGSDWPVCLLATTHQHWFSTLQDFIEPLSAAEQELILGGVATKVYSLQRSA